MIKVYIFKLTTPIYNKDKSLIGQILAKKIVSNETLTPKKNVLIGKTKLGKPIIRKPSNLNLDISISHSGSYLAVGICNNGKIGVDIELLKDIDIRVFRNCLSANEEIYINSGKEIAQRLENFYEIWTIKEAYLKALGIGLQKPLPIMHFYPDYIKPRAELTHDNQQYYLSTLKEDKFILSVCTTRLIAQFNPLARRDISFTKGSTLYYNNMIEISYE
jgi:4'-phosphopantetheinyl transferase